MDGPFTNAQNNEGCLKVRGQDDRLNNFLQNRGLGLVTHQGAYQGIPFQGVNRDHQFKMVQSRSTRGSGNPALNSVMDMVVFGTIFFELLF